MRNERGLLYGLTFTGLLGLTLFGWTHMAPASAQGDAPAPGGGRGGQRMFMGGMTAVAASGDFVYVLRGNTLYQMKSADLSVVTQKDLPAPGGGAGGGAAPAAPEKSP
jgi:hypothetical protein